MTADRMVFMDEFPALPVLLEQERRLHFTAFTEVDAFALGQLLVARALENELPLAVAISLAGRRVFQVALAGSTPDNDSWIDRKGAVVMRFRHSSLYMGQMCREDGTDFQQRFGLPLAQYAAHGGAFPVIVDGVGLVGYLAVSGMPQVRDHQFVVTVLEEFLGAGSVVQR